MRESLPNRDVIEPNPETRRVRAGRALPAALAAAGLVLAGATAAAADTIFSDGFESGETTSWHCGGLQCFQVTCAPGVTTSLSGVVFAPNGTLPVPGVQVFVPNWTVGPLPDGAQCTTCGTPPPGHPLVSTVTAADGSFVLDDVPPVNNLPLVLQIGKWRRQVAVPTVASCATTAVTTSSTRLPKNSSEGDLPRIAVSTGAADAVECLLRKLGIDDTEFTTDAGAGRVHLYAGSGGTAAFDIQHGGQSFPASTTLWGDLSKLSGYDLVVLSCEGSQHPETKPQASRDALKAYADLGGRVWAGHWHNYWIQSGPSPWSSVATWNFLSDPAPFSADVDQTAGRHALFADWLFDVGASGSLGSLPISAPKQTAISIDTSVAGKWVYKGTTSNNQPTIQSFSFATPVESPVADRCGRVFFTDYHVSSGDSSSTSIAFPSGGCGSSALTPTEKAILFSILDLGTCTGTDVD